MKKEILCLIISLFVALTACSPSSEAPSQPSSQSPNSSYEDAKYSPNNAIESNEPEVVETPEPAFDITAGPILIEGSFLEGFTAAQMNLSTGEMKTVFSFYNDKQYSFAFDTSKQYYLGSYFMQQLFDGDMTKLAVSWYDQSNSSSHVGWVDQEGNLTDVTALIHPNTSDFSSKVPQDRYALFSPDGYFFFTDMNEECYCYLDSKTMSIIKREPVIIEHGKYSDTTVYNAVFMPNGSLSSVWHTNYSDAIDVSFGDYSIAMPGPGSSAKFKACDYINDGVILCTGSIITYDELGYLQGYGDRCIAEVGKDISWPSVKNDGTMSYRWEYPYSMQYLRVTPATDYNLENCAYSNGRIAFIGNRGNERFLFITNDSPASCKVNPTQIASVSDSWELLFWKGEKKNRNGVYLTSLAPVAREGTVFVENDLRNKENPDSLGLSYLGEKYSHYIYSQTAGSSITWNLNGSYNKLEGVWTICHGDGGASTKEAFEIYTDGVLAYRSEELIGKTSAGVSVLINNCNELKIVFTDGVG